MYLKMAAFRNNDAEKISKSVVNIVDTTMTVFYVHVLKLRMLPLWLQNSLLYCQYLYWYQQYKL